MKTTLALALLASAATGAIPAQATQAQCAPRDHVLERLDTRYGETLQASGLGSNAAKVELYAAPDTGTWTIIVTLPNGMSCLVASGESYQPHLKPAGFPV